MQKFDKISKFHMLDIENQDREPIPQQHPNCFSQFFSSIIEIIVLFIIYVAICVVILLFPCIFSIMFLQKKLKINSKCLKFPIIFIMTPFTIGLIYILIAVCFPPYFVIVVIIQIFKNLCFKSPKIYGLESAPSTSKSFEGLRLIESQKEKNASPIPNSPLIDSRGN